MRERGEGEGERYKGGKEEGEGEKGEGDKGEGVTAVLFLSRLGCCQRLERCAVRW